MRCALLGAFAFPHFQGSQVYTETLARALIREGLEISVLSYGGDETRSTLSVMPSLRAGDPGIRRSGPEVAESPWPTWP